MQFGKQLQTKSTFPLEYHISFFSLSHEIERKGSETRRGVTEVQARAGCTLLGH